MTLRISGLFLKDYLFEEPLEVYAVPIGPSYIKPNTYSSPQSYSQFSSKSDTSLPPFENLSSQTLSVIPEKSYTHSSLKSKVSPTYRHIPLRRKHQIAKKEDETQILHHSHAKGKGKIENEVPPTEISHPHASFLPAPDEMQDKDFLPGGSGDDWVPGNLIDYSDYTSSDYILDYLEKTFYQLPDYSDFFPEELPPWQKSSSSGDIVPRSSAGLQAQTSESVEHIVEQPSTLLAPSRLVVSEPDLGSNSYDRRLIVEVPADQPPGDPLENLVKTYFPRISELFKLRSTYC